MEPFTLVQGERIDYLELTPWMLKYRNISVGFSSRLGGYSGPPYESLNLAMHVGDQSAAVIQNRKQVMKELGLPFERWTCAEQVHGRIIHVVTEVDIGKGRLDREDAIQSTDGLITKEQNVILAAYYADCVPLYFFDPVKKVVGLAHAGWKGTVLNIAGEMIRRMESEFGCESEHILTAIGPSIGQCCYEVDSKVIDQIRGVIAPNGEQNAAILDKGNGKFMLDLQETNRQMLLKEGILPYHIEITRRCTSCQTDLFYSHRKEKGNTGRMAAWIGLKG